MRPLNHNIRRACTVIIGTVFFAAGLLKLIDPVGAGMVIGEYFKFFHCLKLSQERLLLQVFIERLQHGRPPC